MKQIWSLNRGVVFRKIENNLFIIQFFHWRDKEKVLDGAPWNFDNQLLLLKDICGTEQPESIEIKHCPFWVRLYNLPLDSRSDGDVRTIAEKIGHVIQVESDELGWDTSRRVRVMVDVTKHLRRIQKIKNKQGIITYVQFKYERLATFCFKCGVLGHTEKDCPNVDEDEELDEKLWGLWLRDSPRKGREKIKEELSKIKAKTKSLSFAQKPLGDTGGEDRVLKLKAGQGVMKGLDFTSGMEKEDNVGAELLPSSELDVVSVTDMSESGRGGSKNSGSSGDELAVVESADLVGKEGSVSGVGNSTGEVSGVFDVNGKNKGVFVFEATKGRGSGKVGGKS
ncbi:uncharacterized protein LOC110722170 [Chenopodium quinoa]|uniref:uncharacterized protein LOC110722170 n=1 Tax=Chenopodium quinoa TaxID=63459 RepID=UPI000B775790|nr:uncharacterized protein LOC110722170 [Chenopodium quinoa]